MADETLKSESTIWLFGRVVTDLELKNPPHAGKKLARIYGFVFHNEYFDLGAPALFIVDDNGVPVKKNDNAANAAATGLGVMPRIAKDLTIWEHDILDESSRLDVMTGTFDRILLDVELAEEGMQDFVRGGNGVGLPTNLSARTRPRRGRRWRSDDD
jgi:hypothetical protein